MKTVRNIFVGYMVSMCLAGLYVCSTPSALGKPRANPKPDDEKAIEIVWRRPEVKKWLAQFPKGTSKLGGHPSATADHDKGSVYSVHVYEDLPDHTATFNWYKVNVKTRTVSKMF